MQALDYDLQPCFDASLSIALQYRSSENSGLSEFTASSSLQAFEIQRFKVGKGLSQGGIVSNWWDLEMNQGTSDSRACFHS